MSVRIRLFAAARAAAGTAAATAQPGTLADVEAALISEFPALERVLPSCSFLLDGTAVHGPSNEVDVPAGSELDVLPPFAGG